MKQFIPWNSQPLQAWARQHAPGKFIDIDGRSTHHVNQGTGKPVMLIHGFFRWVHLAWQSRCPERALQGHRARPVGGVLRQRERFQKVEGKSEIMLRMLRKQFFNTLQEDIRALGQLDVPILLVWGRHDKAISLRRGEEMQRLLPVSRLEIIEQSGHCPHDEQPERFNRLALEFLS